MTEPVFDKNGWCRDMEMAPRDGTMLWLYVDYSGGGGPLEDATRAATIGFNNLEHDGEDEWRFSGWSWCHDCFCQGSGKLVAWRFAALPPPEGEG